MNDKMNKYKYEYFEANEYVLEGNRFFACDKKSLNEKYLSKIKYPLMILDTEFINRSHNKTPQSPIFLRKKISSDLVYIIQYAIYNSEAELLADDNGAKIKKIVIERNVKSFNLFQSYDELKEEFVDACIDNEIKMFCCSGGATDFRLIKTWLYEYLDDEQLKMLDCVNYINEDNWDINHIDPYDIMKDVFSFENLGVDGQEYIDPHRLPHGKQNKQMLQFSSFTKLFNWTEQVWEFPFRDEKEWGIYDLCVEMFQFYNYTSTYRFDAKQMKHFQEVLNITVDHCWNDVYKIIIFMNFCFDIAK
jgi:hypothetical protein